MLLPNVKWAQRRDRLFLTIDIQDCKSPDVKLSNDADNKHGHLVFKGKGEGADPEAHDYGLDLDFFGAIDVEASKVATNDRGVVLIVSKADKDAEEHWPRLLKAAGKAPSNIKIDWDRWQDEDDEAEALAKGGGFGGGDDEGGFGGMDFSSLGGGGMGGMGGMMGGGGGGAGGFDMAALQSMMAAQGGGGGFGGGEDDEDEGGSGDDDDDEGEEGGEEAGSEEPSGKGEPAAASDADADAADPDAAKAAIAEK